MHQRAMVIMDAGIATEANLLWLAKHGYLYLVVRRAGARQFDQTRAVTIETAGGEPIRLQKEMSEDGKEVWLYCHSAGREAKETAMTARFAQGFEAGLQKLADGLLKPRAEKRHDKLLERIGLLKEKSRGASQHYTVTLTTDDSGKTVTALTWLKAAVAGTMASHPGVYCLRSNELNWDEEKLWRTYSMLTDLESVFRSLKSELGKRLQPSRWLCLSTKCEFRSRLTSRATQGTRRAANRGSPFLWLLSFLRGKKSD